VVITGRNSGRLSAIGEETGAATILLEARDSSSVDDVFGNVQVDHGRLDGVVCCAGSILLKPAHMITDSEFAETLALNLTTAFNVLRGAARIMMRQPDGGSIVLSSSVAARRGLINHEAIAAAKAGVEGLALAAAASYARYKVRVNCVAPGLTRTGLTAALTESAAVAKASAALHPLGRIGEPAEVASAICWLLDGSRSSWVTGQVIGVDGGLGNVQARA
jgi:NAD(P)-dependent dehydrogenase (short-subunit alcohol dehydrogenase family)